MPDGSVLILYTGGTIGCVPTDPADPRSPLAPASLEQVMAMVPRYDPVTGRLLLRDAAIPIATLSWDPPIDSSQMTFEHWVQLAHDLEAQHDRHVGFVVLHGTDTLAFTASALAFMLDGLAKPVVLTGSQLPIGQTRSDAVQNLVTAVEIAAAELLSRRPIPEVCVFFRDELLRGCRTTKMSASSFAAFASPNFPALGRAGEFVHVDHAHVRSPGAGLVVRDRLEPRIAVLDVFPGMSPTLLDALLSAGDLKGVVLRGFGTGNVPTGFADALGRAVARGVVVVVVSQCPSGEVSLGLYEASAGLRELGILSGGDLTTEAALTKLAFALGQDPDPAAVARAFRRDLRGEQRSAT